MSRKITVLADFMGEHSCKYLRCESTTAGLLLKAPFSCHSGRSPGARRTLIEYTKDIRLLADGRHPWPPRLFGSLYHQGLRIVIPLETAESCGPF